MKKLTFIFKMAPVVVLVLICRISKADQLVCEFADTTHGSTTSTVSAVAIKTSDYLPQSTVTGKSGIVVEAYACPNCYKNGVRYPGVSIFLTKGKSESSAASDSGSAYGFLTVDGNDSASARCEVKP